MRKLSDGRTDGQTDGQTDESDFTGRCPTNVERPIWIFPSLRWLNSEMSNNSSEKILSDFQFRHINLDGFVKKLTYP